MMQSHSGQSAAGIGANAAAGVVVSWNPDRGFGFVKLDKGAPDVFLHFSALRQCGLGDRITVGQRVLIEIEEDPRTGRARVRTIQLAGADMRAVFATAQPLPMAGQRSGAATRQRERE
jgi:CspA family cold shock protein